MPAKLSTPRFHLELTRGGYWEVRWVEGGKPRFKSTRTKDWDEAEAFLRRFVVEWHTPKLSTDPLITELVKAYRIGHLPTIHSQVSQGLALDKLDEFFGDRPHGPAELTETVLRQYATWRRSQKRWGRDGNIADGTIAREVNALRAVLGWAYRNRLLTVRYEIRQPVTLPPPRQRYLTTKEVSRLLDAAEPMPHLELYIRIAIASCARKSAILQAKWSNVRFPEPNEVHTQINLHPEWGEVLYIKSIDNFSIDFGSGRGNKKRSIVALGTNRSLYRDLLQAKIRAKTDYVIEFRGQPVKDVKTAMESACKTAGLIGVTPHTLKHTGIVWMVQSGMSFSIISKLVGTSVQTLERHYSHLSPEMSAKVGDLMDI